MKFISINHLAKILVTKLSKVNCELFIALYFDRFDNLKENELLSVGTKTQVKVSIRQIIEIAIKKNIPKIVVAHNHTSNIITPSQSDITFTKKLRQISEELEIKLLAHIIVGKDDYYII